MPEALAPDAQGVAEATAAMFAANPADGVSQTPAATAIKPEQKPIETPAAPEQKPLPEAKPAKKEFTDEEIAAARKEKPDHKAWKILDSIKAKSSASEAALKSELEKLKQRPETPANDARMAQLEKLLEERDQKIKERDQRLEEADFTRTEQYTQKYILPYNNEWKNAISTVKGLTVMAQKDGETITRQGTEADFMKAAALPPSEQDDFIEATFGKSAWRVTKHLNKLYELKDSERAAVEDFAANYEKNKVQRELDMKRQREAYEKELGDTFTNLQKDPELGSYLSESETDPDGTKIYKAELDKFNSFKTTAPTAADAATVRARYAMAPRLLHVNKQLSSKVASLEAELAKFRGADPGAAVKTAANPAAPAAELGVEEKIKSLSWDGRS